jgi:hypothetical protein
MEDRREDARKRLKKETSFVGTGVEKTVAVSPENLRQDAAN